MMPNDIFGEYPELHKLLTDTLTPNFITYQWAGEVLDYIRREYYLQVGRKQLTFEGSPVPAVHLGAFALLIETAEERVAQLIPRMQQELIIKGGKDVPSTQVA